MAELIVNVYAAGVGYGPSFGNADAVPAEHAALIGDHCWDSPPDRSVEPVRGADGGPGDDGAATGTAAPEPAPPADLGAMSLDELREVARAAGVKVDSRWGAPRLRVEIGKANG